MIGSGRAQRLVSARAGALALAALLAGAPACGRKAMPGEVREHLVRAAALAVDTRWSDAEQEFDAALERAPNDADALFGAALAGLNGTRDSTKIRRTIERFIQLEPDSAAGAFVLALALRRAETPDLEAALAAAQRAAELAPQDNNVAYVVADTLKKLGRHEEAIAAFEHAFAIDGRDASAYYQASQMLRRIDPARSTAYLNRYRELEALGLKGTNRDGNEWSRLLDQRLLRIAPGAPAPPDPALALTFRDASPGAGVPAGAKARSLAVGDVDGDGRDDLAAAGAGLFLAAGPAGGIAFRDATAAAGLGALVERAFDALYLFDFDNDGALDLLALGAAGSALFRNDGKGAFADDSAPAKLTELRALRAVVFDYDHEGDLDVLALLPVAAGLELRLLRNDLPPVVEGEDASARRPSFTDVTAEAGIGAAAAGLVAEFGDVDNGNDTDVLALGSARPGRLFSNLRGGRFADLGRAAGVEDWTATALALGDVDGDLALDAVFAGADGRILCARNSGEGLFEAPIEVAPAGAAVASLCLADPDNDGDLDLFAGAADRVRLFRNARGTLAADAAVGLDAIAASGLAWPAAIDLDGDGDADLAGAAADGSIALLENDGGNANARLLVHLEGQRSNRTGIGCKLDIRHDDLELRVEAHRTPVALGLGPIARFRQPGARPLGNFQITWSNGVRQPYYDVAITDPAWPKAWDRAPGVMIEAEARNGDPLDVLIRQIHRVDGSCPLLYAWNGERFEFITDVLCSSPLGLDLGGHQRAMPNPDDAVTVRGDQLRDQDGRYLLRLTEELREVSYVDRVRLLAVDHPADVEVHTDNKFTFPPAPPFEVHPVKERRALARATDDRGNDVAERLAARDGVRVDSFRRCLPPIEGLAEMHHLDLDLGAAADAPRVRLFLEGWFLWSNASVNNALAQDGTWQFTPPLLAVGDGNGGFKPAGMVGIPEGGTKVVVCDLTGLLVPGDPRVRITTNLQVFWDWIFVAVDPDPAALPVRVTELAPATAELRYRGYSERVRTAHSDPGDYVYEKTESDGSTYASYYGNHQGQFTRYGDVRPLLDRADDCYVIMNHGDEIALEFDAAAAPDLPPGWTRTYVMRSIGWAKDGDYHSDTADRVEPLPFLAMSRYPYPESEHYPDDAEHRAYRAEWNTRSVASPRREGSRRPERARPAPPPAAAERLGFTEVAEAWGVDFEHREGRVLTNLEDTMGAGAALGDIDGDGDDDLYLVQGSGPGGAKVMPGRFTNRLFRNDGDGFADVTEVAGVGLPGFGMGALFADFDNDGDQDLYVTNLGPNVLYRNDGAGLFRDVTFAAGVGDPGFGAGAAAGDYDKDGDLDLYVGNYVVVDPVNRPTEPPGFQRGFVRDDPPSVLPMTYPPARNVLYRNELEQGAVLRFTDVTDRAGVADPDGRTLGVLFVDFDEDGWLDLYCANDVSLNAMFHNQGNGTFEPVAFDVGLDDPRGGMGVAAADVDGDRDLDLATTYWQSEPNAIYRNNVVRHQSKKTRVPSFEDVADALGFAKASIGRVGWGIALDDFDQDGALDAFIANGYTSPDYETTSLCVPQRPLFFLGAGAGAFAEATDPRHGAILGQELNGRGVATADLDRDGDLDLVVTQNNGKARILRNDGGERGAWLAVSLAGTRSPRDPAGARVEVRVGDRVHVRHLAIGSSYLSCTSKTLHLGLGPAERYDGVTVRWPSGRVTELPGGPTRQRIAVTETAED